MSIEMAESSVGVEKPNDLERKDERLTRAIEILERVTDRAGDSWVEGTLDIDQFNSLDLALGYICDLLASDVEQSFLAKETEAAREVIFARTKKQTDELNKAERINQKELNRIARVETPHLTKLATKLLEQIKKNRSIG